MNQRRMVGTVIVAIGLAAGRLSAQGPSEADSSFRAFLPSFEAGLLGLLNGDTTLWFANASHADDVTLFTPFGTLVRGWNGVSARYRFAASHMAKGGATLTLEYIRIDASGDLAVMVAVEHSIFASVPEPGTTRVTSVFRREEGQWKLVHRHMDHLPLDATAPSQ